MLAQYAEVTAGFGAPLLDSDAAVLDQLTTALADFAESIPRWVDAIPEADILFAATLPEI